MSGLLLLAAAFTYTVTPAHADLTVTAGTGNIGNGHSLSILWNAKQYGGSAFTFGGTFHSPSGAPDLFFRAGSTPTFPGELDNYFEWASFGSEISPGLYLPSEAEGAVDGTDNWAKIIRDGDGAVNWAKFQFGFSPGPAAAPILIDIPLYVWSTDGADFTLAEAVAASTIPEPSTVLLTALGGLMMLGVVRRQRK